MNEKIVDQFSLKKLPPTEDKKKRDKSHSLSLFRFIQEFASETTCHGVKRVLSSENHYNIFKWKNITWFILLAASFGLAGWSVAGIFEDFYAYPVNTVVGIEYHPGMNFPVVMVCNLNPAIMSRIPFSHRYFTSSLLKMYGGQSLKNQERKKQAFSASLRFLNETDIYATGHQLSEMLLDCSYDGDHCYEDDFEHSYSLQFGNCYSFNPKKKMTGDVRKQYKRTGTGPSLGLKMILDVQQDLYMETSMEVGMKVVIYKEGEVPFPENKGLVVSPGYSTYMSLSRFDIKRAKEPYDNCLPSDGDHNPLRNMFAKYGYSYTDIACKKTCYQAWVLETCGCCDTAYPCDKDSLRDRVQNKTNFESMYMNSSPRHCDLTDATDMLCFTTVLFLNSSGEQRCSRSCPHVCDASVFQSDLSFSAWPSLVNTDFMFKKMGGVERFGNLTDIRDRAVRVKENLLKVNIYLDSVNAFTVHSEPAYNWNRLLGDLGGQLGLWLGFSLLTAAEIVQFCFDLLIHCVASVASKITGRKI